LERLARDKDSCLLGPFVSYEENKVLYITTLDCIHNISFFGNFQMGLIS
jgi:hypothetical protein